jgi:glutamine amidotransferase
MLLIVDYGVGNLNSILNMLKKGGINAGISNNKNEISSAAKLLLPGMGHFDNCMIKFNESGFREIIERKVFDEKVPLLGICVGLQMFMASSEEGNEPGLGWIKGKTVRFRKEEMGNGEKIPNMGWLEVKREKESPLMAGLEDARFYFAHSYHVEVTDSSDILTSAEYGYKFTVGVERDNILGVQFHPEKSHRFGMRLLKNFAENY